MPTLNIKDPEVYELARELAAQRQTSMTGAIREALQAALAAEDARRAGRFEAMLAIARFAAVKDAPWLTDDDLYDERGLPK